MSIERFYEGLSKAFSPEARAAAIAARKSRLGSAGKEGAKKEYSRAIDRLYEHTKRLMKISRETGKKIGDLQASDEGYKKAKAKVGAALKAYGGAK